MSNSEMVSADNTENSIEFMPQSKNVVVVSAFGRGHWAAVELIKAGLNVTLLDVSERLKSWVPEDAEGPWGLFQPERFGAVLQERMVEDDEMIPVENGLTFWLSTGPLELRGPVSSHRLNQLHFQPVWWDSKQPPSARFSHSWLWYFGYAWARRVFYESTQAFRTGFSLPLTLPFFIRRASRQGHAKSLDWCERNSVQVLKRVDVSDIAVKARGQIKGVEVIREGSSSSEIIEADQFIWCLSSEETDLLGVRVRQALFPQGTLEPLWVWQRFRLKFEECRERQVLPQHFICIQDTCAPWVHENMMVVQRTSSQDLFDIWVQIPNIQRFNKEYIRYRGEKIIEVFRDRLPEAKVVVHEYPEGMNFTYTHVGPARHPVFEPQLLKSWQQNRYQNFQLDAPESRKCLGHEGAWIRENEIINEIKQWWEQDKARQLKEHVRRTRK